VASGVVEEQVSRVVEILLAKAPPGQLLAGKVIGIGVVGLVQLVAFVVIGLTAANLSGTLELPPGTLGASLQTIAWFVLGFAFYSCLFAVGGAMASRVEELQSTTTPLTFLAVGSFFAAMVTGGDPNGPVATVATFVPFSAPMVLPIRVAAGEVGLGTVLVSVGIVLVSIAAVMALAARVYAAGVLHLRGQLKLRNALRREAA
jgi:ABC-2 type transport system permease protein